MAGFADTELIFMEGGDGMAMENKLEAYLDRLVGVLGHANRRVGLRDSCRGLMLPIARKSVEPLAAHLEPEHVRAKHQSLHHFVAQSAWSDAAVLREVGTVVEPVLVLQVEFGATSATPARGSSYVWLTARTARDWPSFRSIYHSSISPPSELSAPPSKLASITFRQRRVKAK